jgi:hypothetical protein
VASPGENARPDSELLDHVKQRNASKKQHQKLKTPLRGGLRRRYDISGISVSEHDEQSRPHKATQRRLGVTSGFSSEEPATF